MKLEAKIKKQFPAFQLDVNISANGGAIVLWGASGAGKTLTLNSLAGFTKPDAGRILIGDDLLFDAATKVHVPPQKRRCGYIFQDHALFPHMTVSENLRFAASVSGQSSRLPKIKELLDVFELTDLALRKPVQLSGGQQQRAALARAMVTQPHLLLLDEPTQGLDSRLKRNFFDLLVETRRRTEALIVLVTHDLDECFEMGEYICLMERGKVIQAGTREQVFAKPINIEVAKSLGIYNVIPAEIEALDPGRNISRFRMLGATWTGNYFPGHLLGDKGFAAFRETSVRLSHGKDGEAFQVKALKPFARGVRMELEYGLAATITEFEAREIRVGGSVQVQISPNDIVFLSK